MQLSSLSNVIEYDASWLVVFTQRDGWVVVYQIQLID